MKPSALWGIVRDAGRQDDEKMIYGYERRFALSNLRSQSSASVADPLAVVVLASISAWTMSCKEVQCANLSLRQLRSFCKWKRGIRVAVVSWRAVVQVGIVSSPITLMLPLMSLLTGANAVEPKASDSGKRQKKEGNVSMKML